MANFNLVQVIGCLNSDPSSGWTLTKASTPAVTKDDVPDAAALARAATAPLGDQSFQLVSVVPSLKADEQAGYKVEARGLLYRSASESLLNVTGLTSLELRCP